jgi:hypothetical protein
LRKLSKSKFQNDSAPECAIPTLKHDPAQPDKMLTTLRDMQAEAKTQGTGGEAAVETIQKSLTYLEKRREHMTYARFQALGYPIGSGSVESANQLVVEARLKGAGMHWARPHVDPMLALRNIACSDRCEEAWPQISGELRRQAAQRRAERRQKRTLPCNESPALMEATPVIEKMDSVPIAMEIPTVSASLPMPVTAPAKTPWHPAPDHPWRHDPIGKARFRSPKPNAPAKL